jgi:hypothetical protein
MLRQFESDPQNAGDHSLKITMKLSGPTSFLFGVICVAIAVSTVVAAQDRANEQKNEQRQRLFVITDQEGYGTGDCLGKEGECGKIIANSFCESNGFKSAEFYRKADPDDVTGSIASERKPVAKPPQAYIISCK